MFINIFCICYLIFCWVTGVQHRHLSTAGCGGAGGWEPGLRSAVQQRSHLGLRESLLRPLSPSPAVLSRRPEVCHIYPTLPAHVCSHIVVTDQDCIWGQTETEVEAEQEGLKGTRAVWRAHDYSLKNRVFWLVFVFKTFLTGWILGMKDN